MRNSLTHLQISSNVVRLYRENRQHQRDCQMRGGGCTTTYPDGRIERSYGSAAYGLHAAAALSAAKRHVAWLTRNGVVA